MFISIEGGELYGPFENEEEASAFADEKGFDEWWIAEPTSPENENDN